MRLPNKTPTKIPARIPEGIPGRTPAAPPPRIPGRPPGKRPAKMLQRPWMIVIAAGIVALSFLAALKAMDWLTPDSAVPASALAELPPLPPVTRSSYVVASVTVALSAIRDAADRAAPRNFAGKANNPISQLLQNADIGWTASRGPIALTGGQDALSLSTPLSGKLNATGSLSAKTTGAIGDAIAGLLGNGAAKKIGSVNIKSLNASADIKGNVVITARPKLAAAWRLEPNLGAQVSLGDSSLAVAGARVNVPAQVKPMIDKTVDEQLNAAAERVRNDPILEHTARTQWAKACRSVLLQGVGDASSPPLWLELKPTRAIAAQPHIDATAMTLIMGIQAAGERLLISLLVRAREKKSLFGLGAEATLHIWGSPEIDQTRQTLRLSGIELAVESESAFGLLGAAARTVMPRLQGALAEKAIVDLKPFASAARERIASAIADLQKTGDGVRVAADIKSLILTDIAFDSQALRVIAAAEGAINVSVSAM